MGAMGKKAAIRTCAGCRQTEARDALLRFACVAVGDRITADVRRRAPGRGISVHPRRSCLTQAVKKGAFRRAFSAKVNPTAGELVACAAEQYREQIERLLAVARRNRQLLCGGRAVRASLKARTALLVVVANDASEGMRTVARSAAEAGARGLYAATRARLGRISGRRSLQAVAITDPDLAERIISAAERAAAFEEDA